MAEALTALGVFIMAALGIMMTLTRRTRMRAQETAVATEPQVGKPRTKRQEQLLASLEPAKELPTIEQLVAEEAAETGVNDIPGGEGLDVSLKLRVYWRDEVVRRGCEDGHLEFRVTDGIDPESAATEDIRLVCIRNGAVVEMPLEDEPAANLPDDHEAE